MKIKHSHLHKLIGINQRQGLFSYIQVLFYRRLSSYTHGIHISYKLISPFHVPSVKPNVSIKFFHLSLPLSFFLR